jgi:hypothetical protein
MVNAVVTPGLLAVYPSLDDVELPRENALGTLGRVVVFSSGALGFFLVTDLGGV